MVIMVKLLCDRGAVQLNVSKMGTLRLFLQSSFLSFYQLLFELGEIGFFLKTFEVASHCLHTTQNAETIVGAACFLKYFFSFSCLSLMEKFQSF